MLTALEPNCVHDKNCNHATSRLLYIGGKRCTVIVEPRRETAADLWKGGQNPSDETTVPCALEDHPQSLGRECGHAENGHRKITVEEGETAGWGVIAL